VIGAAPTVRKKGVERGGAARAAAAAGGAVMIHSLHSDGAAQVNLDPAPTQLAQHRASNGGVELPHDLGRELHKDHACAERLEDEGVLDPDDASALPVSLCQ
jgi:hypothetical protein